MRKNLTELDRDTRRRALLEYLSRLLPDPHQRAAFWEGMTTEPAPALRLNPLMSQARLLKPAVSEFAEPVAWCDHAFVLPRDRCRLGRCLEHALGAFYIQAKATTLAVEALDPQPGERVLDLAAAPGGKATHIAAAMANRGLLVANEPQKRRMPALIGNLERLGVHNAVVTRCPGTIMARHFHNFFDRVLLDAPCSGDGILCKDESLLHYWSPEDATRKSHLQAGLLRAAFHTLRPGGVLVYSTCSLSTEENEDVVAALFRRYPGQVEVLPVAGVTPNPLPPRVAAAYPGEFAHMVRVWPHLQDTEGAFVARLRKTGGSTAWPRCEGDVGLHIEESEKGGRSDCGSRDESDSTAEVLKAIENRWEFRLSPADSDEVAVEGKRVNFRPRASSAIRSHFPGFLRAGMRLASRHRGYSFLSQQAVALLGHGMGGTQMELTWPQVREAFEEGQVQLREAADIRGDVICRFGPWTLCRGLVQGDGHVLETFLPKVLRTPELSRLTDV